MECILLIFSSNQAVTQIVSPSPPFGLVTTTILVSASYLMLLGSIGHAEMEKEIQNTVKQVNRDKQELEKELEEPVELDEMELEKCKDWINRKPE